MTQEVWRRRYALIDTIGDWHKAKDTLPVTLAHNDFNQRNVGFRRNDHAPEPPPEPLRNGAAKSNGSRPGSPVPPTRRPLQPIRRRRPWAQTGPPKLSCSIGKSRNATRLPATWSSC